MIARELIDTAQVPGGEELSLFRHGGDFMIVLDTADDGLAQQLKEKRWR